MESVAWFGSPLVTIREVVCTSGRGAHGDEEESDEPCIAIPLRGCYTVARRRDVAVADPTTAAFFEAGVPYRVGHPADEGDVSFVLACDPGIAADAFGNGRRRDAERRPFRATHAHLDAQAQLRARMLRRVLLAGDADPLLVEEAALALITSLAGARTPQLDAARRTTVVRAQAFIAEHFRESVSLRDVAHAARTSPFALARAFPIATGTTLHRALVALRLAAALDALAEGATDLARVAVDAGFAHHSHLTATMRRTFGTTPSALRERLRAS
ncbi:MAG: AraC family transcriptional regulator [Vulcanimicrobiaceae bacterium]